MFDIKCEGEGLSAPETVSVGPRTEAICNVTFKPVFIGKADGSVLFTNDCLGRVILISLTASSYSLRKIYLKIVISLKNGRPLFETRALLVSLCTDLP